MRRVAYAATAVSMTWLAACAAPGPEAVPAASAGAPADMRILIKLTQASDDTAAIAAKVAASAGMPARYLAATSPQWHALALACGGPQACDAALQRLGANKTDFEAVQRDERKRIVTP
jgi:hypothetical protein